MFVVFQCFERFDPRCLDQKWVMEHDYAPSRTDLGEFYQVSTGVPDAVWPHNKKADDPSLFFPEHIRT